MSFKYVCGGALGVQPKTKTKNNMLLQTIIMEQENDSEHMKHLELKAPGTQQVRVKEVVFLDDDSGVLPTAAAAGPSERPTAIKSIPPKAEPTAMLPGMPTCIMHNEVLGLHDIPQSPPPKKARSAPVTTRADAKPFPPLPAPSAVATPLKRGKSTILKDDGYGCVDDVLHGDPGSSSLELLKAWGDAEVADTLVDQNSQMVPGL